MLAFIGILFATFSLTNASSTPSEKVVRPIGHPDDTFNEVGFVNFESLTAKDESLTGSDILIDSLGRYVVAGRRTKYGPRKAISQAEVWRYLSNGKVDRSFGNSGRASIPSCDYYGVIVYLAETEKGELLTLCWFGPGENPHPGVWVVALFDANGKIVLNFEDKGVRRFSGGLLEWRPHIIRFNLTEKSILFAGYDHVRGPTGGKPKLVALLKKMKIASDLKGHLFLEAAKEFGEAGAVTAPVPYPHASQHSLDVQNGQLIAAGFSEKMPEPTAPLIVTSLDIRSARKSTVDAAAFTKNVDLLARHSGRAFVPAVARLVTRKDGGIILTLAEESTNGYALALNRKGELDQTYGIRGFVSLNDIARAQYTFGSMTLAPSGFLYLTTAVDSGLIAISLKPNGSLNSDFGSAGVFYSKSVPQMKKEHIVPIAMVLDPKTNGLVILCLGQLIRLREGLE